MTNIKKHRFKTVLSVMLTLLLILSAVTFAVSAAEATAVGVRLTTDKEEYSADEDIALTLGIKNTGTDRLTDIAYNITAPDGYELKSGSNSGGELELLAGGTLEYNRIYSAIAATPDNPETSGSINPTIPLITGTVCIAALFMLHRKKAKNLIALILCVTLSASALPLDVAAEEIGKNASRIADVTVTKDITAGGDNANFTVTANTYAIQSMGTVKFSNMTFTAAGEFYGVNADTVSFDRCKIKTTGRAGADESYSTGVYGRNLTFSDCNLDISTGIIGETIDIAGATDGKITAPYGSAVTVKCKTEGWSETASGLMTVALDKGHSVLFATAAGTSALQALDFEGGENKIVSYPQTTAPDKEYELTKDYCWLIKEKNGTGL